MARMLTGAWWPSPSWRCSLQQGTAYAQDLAASLRLHAADLDGLLSPSLCRNLKMGVIEDHANRDTLASLLRFPSSKSGEDSTSFADYVGRCAPFVSRSSFSLIFVPFG